MKRKKVGARLAVTGGTALLGRKLVKHGEKRGAKKGYKTGRSVGRIEGIVAASRSMRRKKPEDGDKMISRKRKNSLKKLLRLP